MRVKFTKLIEEEHEVDIPLEVIEENFNGYVEDAVEYYVQKSTKLDENVEIENIRKSGLDYDDKQWQEMMDRREMREEMELVYDYYASLGVI